MTQEPQKSNTVLIIIAIIGVVGTIVASTIGVIGNYNIEKLRQDSESTQIALVLIATQGGATQMVLENTANAPTQLPYPTYTPYPTNTFVPPTITPVPTQTPDLTLFRDEFNDSYSNQWKITGDNYHIVNNTFQSAGGLTALVGDSSWKDYSVELLIKGSYWIGGNDLQIWIRHQDNGDHLEIDIANYTDAAGNTQVTVSLISNGNKTEIPSGIFRGGPNFAETPLRIRIEAKGNMYRIFTNGELKIQFTDENLSSGGVGIFTKPNIKIELQKIEIMKME